MTDITPRLSPIVVVAIFAVLGSFVALTYEAFRASPALSFAGIVIAGTLVIFNFIDMSEFNPLSINPNVIGSKNGEVGTLVQPMQYIGNREYEIVVACKKRYAPGNKRGYINGFKGVSAIFSSNVNIKLRGYETDFEYIPPNDTCREGAIKYLKGFDGSKSNDNTIRMFQEKTEQYETTIKKLATYVSELQAQVSVQAKSSQSDMIDIAQNMNTIIKQLEPSRQEIVLKESEKVR